MFSSMAISITPSKVIYSLSSWKSCKYGCASAYSTVNLFLELNTSSFLNKSNPSSGIFWKNDENDFFFTKLTWLRHSLAMTDYIESMSSLVGFPRS